MCSHLSFVYCTPSLLPSPLLAPSLYQVTTSLFKAGDVVCVSDDMGEVCKLQKGHGEWAEDMAQVQ